jgi:hypothetical protein
MYIFSKTLPDFEKKGNVYFCQNTARLRKKSYFCSLNVEVYVTEGFYHFRTYMTVLPSLVLKCKLLKLCNIFSGN